MNRIEKLRVVDTKTLARFIHSNISNCCDFCVNGDDKYTCSSLECQNNIGEWLEENISNEENINKKDK